MVNSSYRRGTDGAWAKSTCTEQLRCQQVKAGTQEWPTLGSSGYREGGANGTEGSQAPFTISCQGHLLSPTASFIRSFIQETGSSLAVQW